MRRPHPRYDARRKAWVTNAGGRLKTLAVGPKNKETEQQAWDAFYVHMAKLGRPVEKWEEQAILLGELADQFAEWMEREVAAGRKSPKTLDYYERYIQAFLDRVGGRRPAASVKPIELELFKSNWHSVQCIQRIFNWGVKMGLLEKNPVRGIERPESGGRERILTREETVRLLRTADQDFRLFLLTMLHTIARPQEVRALRWKHFTTRPVPMFLLKSFKGKKQRKDKSAVRMIPLDNRMLRMLERLARRRQPHPDDFILLNRFQEPWTGNAVRCRMRRLREKVGIEPDENGEHVVAYTFRHTAATNATVRGVRDRLLGDLMGHAPGSRMTARYQHPQAEHLYEAIQQANGKRS